MAVAMRRTGDTAILEPEGRLAAEAVDEFRSKWMETVADESVRNVVVNLARVATIDSSGIGTMIRLHGSVTKKGGRMRIAAANQTVRQAFRVTRLDSVLEFHETEQSALG